MKEVSIVTADAKSRVVVRGARKGQKFRVEQDGDAYRLEPLPEGGAVRRRNPVRGELPYPKKDLTEHLDQMREAGLDWKPRKIDPPGKCRF